MILKTIKPILNTVKSNGVIPLVRMNSYKPKKSKGIKWTVKHLDAHITYVSPINDSLSRLVTLRGDILKGYLLASIFNYDDAKKTLTACLGFDDKGKPINKLSFYIDDRDNIKVSVNPSIDQKVLFVDNNKIVGIYDVKTVNGWTNKPSNNLLDVLEIYNPFKTS